MFVHTWLLNRSEKQMHLKLSKKSKSWVQKFLFFSTSLSNHTYMYFVVPDHINRFSHVNADHDDHVIDVCTHGISCYCSSSIVFFWSLNIKQFYTCCHLIDINVIRK